MSFPDACLPDATPPPTKPPWRETTGPNPHPRIGLPNPPRQCTCTTRESQIRLHAANTSACSDQHPFSRSGRLFVTRTDGDVCAWIVERPRAGLYLTIMRWLRPWASVSPHLWLAINDRSWPAVVEEWRTLPEFVEVHPHTVFEEDQAGGVVEAATAAAREAGCEREFGLGGLSAQVEMRLWAFADQADQADAFRRYRNKSLGDPDDTLWDLLSQES